MKRLWSGIIALLFFSCISGARAESFFPSPNDVFGVSLPALSFAIHREPDNQENEDGKTIHVFSNLTDDEYYKISKYLGEVGCVIDKASVTEQKLTLLVSKNQQIMEITYDYDTKNLTVTYPEGTRIESTKGDVVAKGVELFPSIEEAFGVGFPSMQLIVAGSFNAEKLADGRTRLVYENVSEEEYAVFSRYLHFYGCTYDNLRTGGGSISALIINGNAGIEFTYNVDSKVAELIYPTMSYIIEKEYSDDQSLPCLLPIGEEAFGVDIPRIALVCGLQSEGLVKSGNGYKEVYKHFTKEQYELFSTSLLNVGCTMKDYSVEDSVMTINLERNGEPFILEYDHEKDIATVYYSEKAHIEPTPIPEILAKETPAPERDLTLCSEDSCWYTAETYFMNLRWKNPKSVVIHSHTSSFVGAKEGKPEYLFTIDYSAENGFGGTNRKTALIWVDAESNRVSNAWIE